MTDPENFPAHPGEPLPEPPPAAPPAPTSGGPTRRGVIQGAAGIAAAGMVLARPGIVRAASENPVKIGFIEDESGNLSIYGIQKLHAARLAVQEINDGYTLAGGPVGSGCLGTMGLYTPTPPTLTSGPGAKLNIVNDGGTPSEHAIVTADTEEILIPSGEKGLLGRPVDLLSSDGQSNNTLWQQLARRMIQQDKVDVLVAGFASAEREAIRPIVDQRKQLYFYTNQYEGGVADGYTFCTGAVCEQQVIPVMQYMVEKFGPKIFTIAANYNFGQLTAAWVRSFAPVLKAKVIGEEFPPLEVSEFSSVIAKVQAAKPDWVMTLLVGQNQSNYYPQAAAAGLHLPMASTVNMAQGYEHKRFTPPSLANMHNAVNYMQEIPTKRNQDFVARFYKMFPNDPYLGQMAQNTYFSIHLYAKAVRLIGTTDQEKVRRTLEAGWAIEAPEGTVFLEPATHHASHYIRLAATDEKQQISFVREWPMIEAWWLQRLGVNLVRHPEYKQYTPQEDPFFKMFS
ncbi:MAG TPA: ABC transporter substrate-binding protein [Acetobacteraceae bacterium]|nr:ABC transporter substrate-binding protein [Acetobacteraceae bacterium]